MKKRIIVLTLIICFLFTSLAFGAVEKPGKVKNVKAASDYGKVFITFDKVSGASGYKIYYSEDEDFGYKSTTGYPNGKNIYLDANKTYYFKVRAYKTVNEKKCYGAYSDIVMATTKESDPSIFFSAKSEGYNNETFFFAAPYDFSYPLTLDLYSFVLCDATNGKIITTYSPNQFVFSSQGDSTQKWQTVTATTYKIPPEYMLGLRLKPQYGYTRPDFDKHVLAFTGEYNGKHYLFKLSNNNTEYTELNWTKCD